MAGKLAERTAHRLLANLPEIKGRVRPWSPSTKYEVGDAVTNRAGTVFVCVRSGTSCVEYPDAIKGSPKWVNEGLPVVLWQRADVPHEGGSYGAPSWVAKAAFR